MAAAPTLPLVSVEEYLRTSYEPNCEYLDGVLISKAMPDRVQGRLQALLIGFLLTQEELFGFGSLSEQHIRMSPTRFRIPDVSALTEPPTDGRYADDRTPPLLTIEIASLEEPWPALRAKLSDHLAMGVSIVIIADPYKRQSWWRRKQNPFTNFRHL
jgi:Uma2 family endonuclease